jgi:hypothetical protein
MPPSGGSRAGQAGRRALSDQEKIMFTTIYGSARWLGVWLMVPLLALTLSCATTQENGPDKKYVGAGIGAAVGAVVGGIAGRDAKSVVAGAAAGGAIGYGIGWLVEKYQARKVRDEAQVAQAYGATPAEGPPQVYGYKTWVDPNAIRRGSEAGWISTFDIQVPPGTTVAVTEERAFIDPDGNTISRRTYDYSQDVTGTGGYEFELTIPIPETAPEGKYNYITKLNVNDGTGPGLEGTFQIAADGTVHDITVALAQ